MCRISCTKLENVVCTSHKECTYTLKQREKKREKVSGAIDVIF